jgi:hypothetical protein
VCIWEKYMLLKTLWFRALLFNWFCFPFALGTIGQGCQMVCFQTKKPFSLHFGSSLNGKSNILWPFQYCVAICFILWQFGICYSHFLYFVSGKIWQPCYRYIKVDNKCCLNLIKSWPTSCHQRGSRNKWSLWGSSQEKMGERILFNASQLHRVVLNRAFRTRSIKVCRFVTKNLIVFFYL